MKLYEFINTYLNKKIDFDKHYGAQCVDVFRQYCKDVLNIEHTGSVIGAKDLFLNYENLPLEKKYFEKLKTNNLFYGDVIVWDKSISNEYGHVAIVINQLSENDVLVIEQDGFNQQGLKFKTRNLVNNLGVLRFKGGKV